MADKIILVDTSILIDYYRKTDKEKTTWIGLIRKGYSFAISAVTKYEIYTGAKKDQIAFWDTVFQQIPVIAFDEQCVESAIEINSNLKRKRKLIDVADLFIAATALAHDFTFATLNRKHFDRIEELNILELTGLG
jgi:tRNA(fMet)-specific endonuclease VapC